MIRQVLPADWLAFRDIRLDMLRTEPGAYASTFDEWERKPEAMIRDWLEHLDTYGDYEGRRIVSCAALSVARSTRVRHRAEVIAVYTRPEARGRGRLRGVLSHVATAARKRGIVQLELQVAADNATAISVYERIGFATVGRIPRAVCDGGVYGDDLLMVWPIDGGAQSG